jgi:hypothetical protein
MTQEATAAIVAATGRAMEKVPYMLGTRWQGWRNEWHTQRVETTQYEDAIVVILICIGYENKNCVNALQHVKAMYFKNNVIVSQGLICPWMKVHKTPSYQDSTLCVTTHQHFIVWSFC